MVHAEQYRRDEVQLVIRAMTMTDPIADVLKRIRNANRAQFDTGEDAGLEKLKEALAAILEKEGFIAGYSVSEAADKPGSTLEITMKYADPDPDHRRAEAGVQARLRIRTARRPDPPRARRGGGGGDLDEPRIDDRPRGAPAPLGRGGPLLCLVSCAPGGRSEVIADVRVGRAPIAVPDGVSVTLAERSVTVAGPQGTLERSLPGSIATAQDGDVLTVSRPTTSGSTGPSTA